MCRYCRYVCRCRYLLTDDGGLVGGGEALHDGHEEHRHVEHGGDPQRDLLPRLGRDQEHEPSQQPLSNLRTLHSFCCENKSFKMCNSSETFPRLLTTFGIVEVKCEQWTVKCKTRNFSVCKLQQCQWSILELQTKVCEDFTFTKKGLS